MKGTTLLADEPTAEEPLALDLDVADLDQLLVEEAALDFDIEDVLVTEEVSVAAQRMGRAQPLPPRNLPPSNRHTRSHEADVAAASGEDTRRRAGIGRRVRRLLASIFGG